MGIHLEKALKNLSYNPDLPFRFPKEKKMQIVKCVCCDNSAIVLFEKMGYKYYQCENCQTLFVPDGIDQKDMVGGEHEVGRNEKENVVRITRFIDLVGKYGKILDWGCGHGYLVKDCKEAKIDAVGYDKFNPDFDKLQEGQFNLVSLIECVEHLSSPFVELDIIHEKLLPNGIVLLETSFTDVAIQENIPIEDFFYIAPQNGHCTIFSHYGLDCLMKKKGFFPLNPINRNVRCFVKTLK